MVVVRGADDQVAPADQVVVTDLVVVDQRSARRFDHAYTGALRGPFGGQWGGERAAQQSLVLQQLGDHLHGVQHLDHACPVVGQRALHRPVCDKALALCLGARAGDVAAVVHPRQRTHAVPTGLAPLGAQVGELHVGPGLDGFFDQIQVVVHWHAIVQQRALGVAHAQGAVIQLQCASWPHQRHPARTDGAKVPVQPGRLGVQRGRQLHGTLAPIQHLRHLCGQCIALLARGLAVHATRHRTGAVHALAAGHTDHLLTKFAQQHALARNVGVRCGHAQDVALRGLAVKSQQQVGRGQVEEMQRMGLHDLSVVHEPTHHLGRARNAVDAQGLVQRLAGGQMVRHGADAAQALHHHRHFPVGAPHDERLEAAELHDVQSCLLHTALGVQQQCDLAVPFHARNGIDHHAARCSAGGGWGGCGHQS